MKSAQNLDEQTKTVKIKNDKFKTLQLDVYHSAGNQRGDQCPFRGTCQRVEGGGGWESLI